jgi:uncharacterized protein (DUF39 family)
VKPQKGSGCTYLSDKGNLSSLFNWGTVKLDGLWRGVFLRGGVVSTAALGTRHRRSAFASAEETSG